MKPHITPATAQTWETCWRCEDLGIPDPTILPNSIYYVINNGNKLLNCCEDCFRRLEEQCE